MAGSIVPWSWKRKRVPVGRDEQSVSTLQRQMNRLFNDFMSNSSFLPDFVTEPLTQLGERMSSFTPNVNVTKNDSALIVAVEVPGMDERDVELSLTKDALTIRGERKQEHRPENDRWHYVESTYGAFERVVPLTDLVIDEDKVEASATKGVVTITLPFKEAAPSSGKKVSIRGS